MGPTQDRPNRRPVLIQTVRGTIDGQLDFSAAVRTLDGLNMLHYAFLTVEHPRVRNGHLTVDDGPLVLNTSGIVFVVENPDGAAPRRIRAESARFTRSAIRLHVDDFMIEGFLHIPGNGTSLARLRQDKHPFMALTSASVIGPQMELASPFVAVNRHHVVAAQELCYEPVSDAAGDDLEVPAAALHEVTSSS